MDLPLSQENLREFKIECNNHLYFGHWEIFRAGLLTIYNQENEAGKIEIIDFLKAVFKMPTNYCCGSPSVPTPYHMQFLCAKLLEELKVEGNYKTDVEFKLLLLQISEFLCSQFIQDVYGVFRSADHEYSPESLKSYTSLVNTNPPLAIELLERLVSNQLSQSHLQMAEEILNQLDISLQSLTENAAKLPERAAILFRAVGFLESLVKNDKLPEKFESLREKLEHCVRNVVSRLKPVERFKTSVKTELYFLLLPTRNLWILEKMHESQYNPENHVHANEVFLTRIWGKDRILNIPELCLEVLETKTHFLERILKCCLHQMETGKIDIVLDILKPPLLDRLWPLVYVLSWETVKTVNQVKSLLNCAPIDSGHFDPLLQRACRKASRNANLALWCLNNIQLNWKGCNEDAKIVEILQDLASHSPLYVINKVLRLNCLSKEVVVSVLLEHSSKDFEETCVQPDYYLDILNGFYIVKKVSKAIRDGQELEYLLKEVCRCMLRKENGDRVIGLGDGIGYDNLNVFYETKIKFELGQVCDLFAQVKHVPLRVQLLEDTFSLLFLQNRHLEIERANYADFSDEGSEGEEKVHRIENSETDKKNLSARKKLRSRKVTRRSRTGSSATTSSSGKKDVGLCGNDFVCPAYIARDLLYVLKESLLETEISVRGDLEIIETSKNTVLAEINKLSKYINDAIWRLRIMTNEDWLESEAFRFSTQSFCRHFIKKYSQKCGKIPELYRAAEPVGSSTEETSERSGIGRRRFAERFPKIQWPSDESVICMMLASQESLVFHCLRKNDFTKARQAIKMFNIRDSDCAHEVKFARSYKTAINRLGSFNSSADKPTSRPKSSKSDPPHPPLRKLSQIAVEAIQSACAVEIIIVDELLSTHPVPFPSMSFTIQQEDIEENPSRSLVIFDLATVSTCDFGSSLKLLKLAKDRLPKIRKNGNIWNNIHGKVSHFLDKLIKLTGTWMKISDKRSKFNACRSVNELVSGWGWSLEPKVAQRVLETWRRMDETLGRTRCDVGHIDATKAHPFEDLVNEVNDMATEIAAEFVFELMDPNAEELVTNRIPNYLKMVLDYANSLKSLLGNCTSDQITMRSKDMEAEGSLSLLRLPQKEIIRRLLQNAELTSEKLQHFATQSTLINLPLLIIQQCTPRIRIRLERDFANNSGTWKNGHFVLNEPVSNGEIISSRHPDVIVEQILGDLIGLMQEQMALSLCDGCVFSQQMALLLCQKPSCWKVLRRSQELAYVDLDFLKSANERTAFFANVANLLTIHALFAHFQQSSQVPLLLSSQLVLRMAAENQFSYRVGQLGIISLLDLRHQILRSDLCMSPDYTYMFDSFSFSSSEIIKVDPRLIFALSHGAVHSPKLQVLHADMLESQLSSAFHDYLMSSVQVSVDPSRILVPQLIANHVGDFVPQTGNHLIDFLTSRFVPEEILRDIAPLGHLPNISNIITVQSFNYTFLYKFKYGSSEPEDRPRVTGPELQSLPEAASGYLRAQCPLASTLTNLLQDTGNVNLDECPVLRRFLRRRQSRRNSVLNAFCSKRALEDGWDDLDILALEAPVDACLHQLEAMNAIGCWRQDSVFFVEDVILEKMVTVQGVDCKVSSDYSPWNLTSRIREDTRRARCVLRNYGNWPAKPALQSLTLCRNLRTIPEKLRAKLTVALNKLTLYDKVCYLVGNGEVTLNECSLWQNVEKAWREDPGQILNALFVSRKFQLIIDWTDCHPIPKDFEQLLEESRVLSILDEKIVDPLVVRSIANSVEDPRKRCCVFQKILPHVGHLEVQLSIARFLLEDSDNVLVDHHRHSVRARKISIQIMLCIPEDDRPEYVRFMDFPLAFIEQLLIHMKMEILQRAISAIREDLVAGAAEGGEITSDMINAILEVYADKAVDFKVVYRKPQSAKSALSFLTSPSSTKAYVKPSVPPKKQDWVPDNDVTKCMVCKLEPFSMFNRRHHCRRCGRVVCATCSQNRAIVKGYQDVLVRVCDECVETSKSQDNASVSRSPSLSRVSRLITASASGDNILSDEDATLKSWDETPATMFSARRIVWELSADPDHDITLREEFSYEQAPSVPLCLSILDLHSDQGRCATFSLKLVRNIFRLLQPIGPGTANREVDYSLTISMALSLLLSAKVNFSKACLLDQVNECDSLLGLADIFKLLVAANCHHLMPYGELDDPDVLRRLRDRLMEEERWKVALEVSTKSGQDVASVNVTWAMFCLRAGKLEAAREMFSRCLRKSQDGYSAALNATTLPKIIDCLESLRTKSVKTSSLQTKLQMIKSGNFLSYCDSGNEFLSESVIWNECVYYLNTYGTHKIFLNFYLRRNKLDLALHHILDKKCEVPVFLEGIWKPCVESGKLSVLLSSLSRHDNTLAVWAVYVGGLCRVLERRKQWNLLYRVQQFCEDHVRAAFICIKFYKDSSKTYLDLFDRLPHLANARAHFEKYLSVKYEVSPIKMQLPRQDIHRHINGIELQVQVTKFLHRNESNTKKIMSTEDPPTVFDNNAMRGLLAALVLLAGSRIDDGFGISYRIIQEFHLKADKVYCLCAKKLVQHGRLEDLNQLVEAVNQSAGTESGISDSCVMTAIDEAISQKIEVQNLEPTLKLISGESAKVEALIRCGKLKSAYLLAVKSGNASDVQIICSEAARLQQTSLQNICEKWLKVHNVTPHTVT